MATRSVSLLVRSAAASAQYWNVRIVAVEPERIVPRDPVIGRLDAILDVIQHLLIVECAKAGVTKGEVRSMLGVTNDRLGRTWKRLKAVRNEPGES